MSRHQSSAAEVLLGLLFSAAAALVAAAVYIRRVYTQRIDDQQQESQQNFEHACWCQFDQEQKQLEELAGEEE
jgi:hypothetical protein